MEPGFYKCKCGRRWSRMEPKWGGARTPPKCPHCSRGPEDQEIDREAGHRGLGVLATDGAFRERRLFAGSATQQAGGPAVDAPDGAAFLQQRQVAANGLGRHTEPADQFVGAHRVRVVDQVDDGVMPSDGEHPETCLWVFDR